MAEDEIERLNRQAREGAVHETLHGVEIDDPYRSLETESPGTSAWVDAQTARTERALAERIAAMPRQRLQELLTIGTISGVQTAGNRVFYLQREGDREQPALYLHENGAQSPDPLVDPLTHGERGALDWYSASPDGKFLAFGISQNGDERSTLHVLDVDNRRLLTDRITHAKWSAVTWLNDESGFYYTRYPREGEPNYDAAQEDTYYPRVFFHALGTEPNADPLVFGGERGTDFPYVTVSDDDRWLVVNNQRGWSATDVYLFDRGTGRNRIAVPTAERPLTNVVNGREHLTTGYVHRSKLYLRTNEDAPRYRIVQVQPQHAADMTQWRDVVPQGDAAIEDWNIIGNKLIVHYLDDVRSRVRLFGLDGRAAGEVQLPAAGTVEGLAGQPAGRTLAFAFSSYLNPPTLFSYDVQRGALTQLDAIEASIDFSRFEVTRERVASRDGTEIPVTLVHARGMQRDGNQPVLLNGYGGFNVAMMPGFTRNALYWIERGGVFAVANLRGGSEFGEEWHQAGRLENKQNVFDDFAAVIRWLSSSGISNPNRIAITGGSNGGLLMGAMITQAPDTFRAATTYVGLYDMLRYHRFPPAELWVSEYGSADDATQFRFLYEYSPYHHLRDGTAYPAVLVETADHDSRVHWGHSTKFAARLQEATSSDRPVYFYMERQVGHGAGTRLSDLVDRYARAYAFVEEQLGVPAPSP